MKEYKGILFRQVSERELFMDIFVPENVEKPPVVMWVHGGGWGELNRTWSLVMPLLAHGYAVASVDYRYCDEVTFPGQMLDLKEALLYLKKHGGEYGYDAEKICLSGDSAGAHLACLIGVSEGNKAWEKPGEDYSVQAIVDISGPISLGEILKEECKIPDGRKTFEQLLGAPSDSKEILAAAAAADSLTYINGTEPPTLIIQGTDDPVVAVSQARRFRNALEEADDRVHMYYVPGGLHSMGGDLFDRVITEFLDFYLKGQKTVTEPKVLDQHYRRYKL